MLIELLPIIDNLESAISNLSENATKEDKEGIELTLKSFESTLDKFGLVPIYPDNEEFNPEKHEAVSMEEDDKKKDGYVGKVFQRGWVNDIYQSIMSPHFKLVSTFFIYVWRFIYSKFFVLSWQRNWAFNFSSCSFGCIYNITCTVI